ncbi:hypothetical protein A0J48_015930 [Sphaerospermopsis aphanizomenoides BCCUSP55]|uniref:hypothetical protein n=1 Tax=Sphaerospermopsis aphanizomenoides TaxID=459663 RepID=UPI001903C710|nr:hypothetical protein [Sphaerospermopsis aphanizomenoides]MBK1989010.1 hypothetical protein [Sphaerospermopsis aphanizomenoides BCCUSP55]
MNSRQKITVEKLYSQSFPIFKWLMTLLLVLNLSSCAEKAGSQEVSINNQPTHLQVSQISRQFIETAPPEVIQELRTKLEAYQPQVKILTPAVDEVIEDNTVTVRFQVKDLPIFKDPQWQLGSYLHVILDNQPHIAVYDLNQPLTLPNLSAGTHTLRVFAARPWHESFKNEGAYAQTKFHIFTKTDDNDPEPDLPLLTYSSPTGSYGAEPIMLDFYLTNAPLHITAEDHPEDTISDWRIRCTINGESFILDRWQTVYLKGFKPGKNWVKLEFLDNQGNPVKNSFNSTVRLITYEPDGQDTLSRIVRGEVTAEEVRGIVDPNYITKIPVTEPKPAVTPKVEVSPIPQPQVEPKVEISPIPEMEVSPIPQPQVEPKVEISPIPEMEVSPVPQPQVEPKVEISPTPEMEVSPIPQPQVESKVEELPTPEIEVSPTPQPQVEPKVEISPIPEMEVSPIPQPQIEPKVEISPTPEMEVSPIPQPQVEPKVEISPTPEMEVSPEPEIEATPEPEITPNSIESTDNTQSKPQKTGLSELNEYFRRKPITEKSN